MNEVITQVNKWVEGLENENIYVSGWMDNGHIGVWVESVQGNEWVFGIESDLIVSTKKNERYQGVKQYETLEEIMELVLKSYDN